MSKIETARLTLRPLQASDATQAYADWLNDPEVNRYLETRHSPQSLESCAAFIEQCNADSSSHLFGIFNRASGQHIGNAKIGFISSHYQRRRLSGARGFQASWFAHSPNTGSRLWALTGSRRAVMKITLRHCACFSRQVIPWRASCGSK